MAIHTPDIDLVILGQFDGMQGVLNTWEAKSQRQIHAHWLQEPQEFFSTPLRANQVILTDTRALGLGVAGVIRRARTSAAQPPVVLIAGPQESKTVAHALELGVDEYVFHTDDSSFPNLLLQIIDRAITTRRDLPLVGDEPARPHFWAFLEKMPIPTKILDEEGTILYASPSFASFLDCHRQEMVDRPIFDFMHPDEAEEATELYRQLLSHKDAIPDTGLAYGHHCLPDRRYLSQKSTPKDRPIRWGNLYLMPLWHADGTLQHVVGFMVDITERKKAALALKSREKRSQAILDTTVDAILTIDDQGYLEAFNQATEELFGYAPQDIQGEHIATLLKPLGDLSALEFIRSIKNSTDPRPLEGQTRSGQTIPLEIGVGQMHFGEQTRYTLVVRDISERVEFLERANRADRMEAVGQFAGGIAHDFNNMLTIIQTNAHLLSHQDLVSCGLGERSLQKILKATERAARLTGNLLSLTPDFEGEITPLNLNHVISGMEDLFATMVEEDIDLEFDLQKDLALTRADLGKIEQVLMNLILNARDAMPRGGPLKIVTCNLSVDDQDATSPRELASGDYVLIEIHDRGTGIAEEIRERIFDPYFTTKKEGTGLGLATIYKIVESLQGTIDIESKPGQGTSFFVYLPAMEEDVNDSPTRPAASPPKRRPRPSTQTILVVEDEEDIRTSLVLVLEQENYQILTAADGQEALECARDHAGPIDLLLTDLVMPRLNGVELANEFTTLYPDAGVIFVSGYAGDVLTRKDIGPDQTHVSKPYHIKDLTETIRETLTAPQRS